MLECVVDVRQRVQKRIEMLAAEAAHDNSLAQIKRLSTNSASRLLGMKTVLGEKHILAGKGKQVTVGNNALESAHHLLKFVLIGGIEAPKARPGRYPHLFHHKLTITCYLQPREYGSSIAKHQRHTL